MTVATLETPASGAPSTWRGPLAARPVHALLFGREPGWHTPLPELRGNLLLFAGCESTSLDAAVSLVRSVDTYSPGAIFALHVVNPSRDDLERLRRLGAMLASTRLAISIERLELARLSTAQRSAYPGIAARFRLAELLPALNAPVLCLRADSLVIAPIDATAIAPTGVEVCTGVHLFVRPTPAACEWLNAVSRQLAEALGAAAATGDERVVAAHEQPSAEIAVTCGELDPRYTGRELTADSVVWVDDEARPGTDLRQVVLQRLLADDPQRRALALRLAAELSSAPVHGAHSPNFARLLRRARRLVAPRVALFVPRLDQPWGALHDGRRAPPPVSTETLALRMHWKEFAARLANAIERRGLQVEVLEWPMREVVPERVDALGTQLALIPHRCKLDYAAARTPTMYYMQEYFRWVFVADREGWSAASSQYPIDPRVFAQAPAGAFDEYRRRLADGRLASKFGQPASASRTELQSGGVLPRGAYVFVPLQIPHDLSIRYFSGVGESELIAALVRWSREQHVPLVLKPHPANPKAMAEFEALPRGELLYWSTANVQSLIEHACAVYTINSGVGFEALLHLKPVVTFGRAEYDCVTIKGRIDTLDDAWRQVQHSRPAELAERYRAFVDWFLGCYAVDLSLEEAASRRLNELADDIAAQVSASRAFGADEKS